MTTFIPSPQQSDIDHAVFNTTHNLAVSALSGTGKTSTLVWIAKRLPKAESKIFCAFNADIVKELQSKLDGTGVTARTFHSLGLGALKKYLDVKDLPPTENKYWQLVNKWAESDGVFSLALSEALQEYEPEDRAKKSTSLRRDTLSLFVKLLSLIRVKLVAWDDVASMESHIAMNQLDADVPHEGLVELVIRNVEHVMKQAEAETRKLVIDFTDMIYWAVKWNLRIYPYKWVLVDEAQDFNPLQREMIAKIIDPKGGRIILVGDPNQAIYAFSGADSNSFDLSVKRWNCTVLPLTMTRRCSQIITQHASRLVPDFNCPPDKPRGKIVWLDENAFPYEVKAGDMVVSRVTVPLVKEFLGLVAKGIPSVILGKDMAEQFITLTDKLSDRNDYSFPNLLSVLATYETEQVNSAIEKGEPSSAIESIRDKCGGLREFINAYPNLPTLSALTAKITSLLDTTKPKADAVVFCTVHKSKGLEADRVFILAPDKLPLMMKDISPEQLQQEYNLLYVAETRAKNTLVIVTNEKFLEMNSQPSYVQNDFEDKVWDKPTAPLMIEAVTPEPVAVETSTESTETFPSFHSAMSEVLGSIGTTHVLYATNGESKMCVSYDKKWHSYSVKTIAPDGKESQEIVTASIDTRFLMKDFQPNPISWQFLTLAEWEEIHPTTPAPDPVVDAVFKSDGLFVKAFTPEPFADAITTPDDPYGLFQINITALLALISNGKGLFAVDGDTKMYVAPNIDKMGMFFLETVNGEYIQEAVTLTEALDKMYAFSPIPFTWNTISANDWMFATASHKTMKERKAEASTPLPFASIMKQHLTELLNTYEPDRGLCADGETTTMYISANWEAVYMVYERDYGQEDDFNWSRDTKDKNAESVLKKMEAINPNPDAWRIVGWGDWLDGTYNASTDEQESPAPVVEPSAVIEASTEQPVIVADVPPTPSADALLVGMIAKCLEHPTPEAGTTLARAIHTVSIPHLMGLDWKSRHDVANMRIAIKRVMREHQYPPSWTKLDMNNVVDALAYLLEHGKLPDAPAPDTRSPFAIAITPRMRELVTGSKQGLFCNEDTTTLFIEIAPDESIAINEFVYTDGRNPVAVVNLEPALSSMESHNPNPDAWQLGDWDTWYKDARTREKELQAQKPNTTATNPIEAPQPTVSVAPVIAPVPDSTPADTTPTFSNGENSQPSQNGKDISPTPAPLPSTATDMLKALIEHFRPFELSELDVVLQAIDYVKREKTEGATV